MGKPSIFQRIPKSNLDNNSQYSNDEVAYVVNGIKITLSMF